MRARRRPAQILPTHFGQDKKAKEKAKGEKAKGNPKTKYAINVAFRATWGATAPRTATRGQAKAAKAAGKAAAKAAGKAAAKARAKARPTISMMSRGIPHGMDLEAKGEDMRYACT